MEPAAPVDALAFFSCLHTLLILLCGFVAPPLTHTHTHTHTDRHTQHLHQMSAIFSAGDHLHDAICRPTGRALHCAAA